MPSKRRALTACVLDSRVYALGGYDGSSWLNTVECFESRTGEWRTEVCVGCFVYILCVYVCVCVYISSIHTHMYCMHS